MILCVFTNITDITRKYRDVIYVNILNSKEIMQYKKLKLYYNGLTKKLYYRFNTFLNKINQKVY